MTQPETNAAQRRWVKTVRIILIFCMLGWFQVIWFSAPAVTLIFWIPYLLALLLSTKFLKTGLVFSLLVLPFFAFVFGGLSFLGALAHLALVVSVLRRPEGRQTKALSTVKVLIVSFVFVSLFAGLVYLALPDEVFHPKTNPRNEASAITSVRNLVTSQITYWATTGEGSYAPDLATLSAEKLIDSVLGSGNQDGYTFLVAGSSSEFYVVARPTSYDETGILSFFADETGVTRFTTEDRPATVEDKPLGQ